MADFAKRSEITISTMGKVHNPTGEGVRAISSQAQAKFVKQQKRSSSQNTESPTNGAKEGAPDDHETKVKVGTAKRNITRKKTDGRDTGNFDSRNKKQGGHGKNQWKMEDMMYDDEAIQIDENDPLYDEEVDGKYILSSHEEPTTKNFDETGQKAIYGPMLTLAEFKHQVAECLQEYFDSCDIEEVIQTLEELRCLEYHPEVIKKAISLSLDRNPRERELVSRLFTCLHPQPMADEDMAKGFDILLDSMDDLMTDVPDAATMVANFVARAVVDEVLSPAYLSEQNNSRPGDPVVEKAVSLLSREHCNARLERVWGPGDGRPVEELKVEMDQLLQEYLLSRELDEAARCVKELDCSHYMHELVKRGFKYAMEEDGKNEETQHTKSAMDAMAVLFGFLAKNAIISEQQVAKGVSRLHGTVDDLKLDVPAADKLLVDFLDMLSEEGCLKKKTSSKK
eukprot:CAMPEP_0119563286 /NCGR_PEP_ID=MMETSP1352-20130426/22912_1 /TAXON_ID=265584 /ORGANISM="Stauroneis constricta, Strain CCMP1120" /LENGTH=452 /DNA_ID=CAMNT_0007611841 /DNA_START=118 /DNA_END=1476 /DNA_ORIENTATION=-